jgi:hypothetical protein
MAVIIGVDPHKATHTAVAISGGEQKLARKKVRSGGTQADQLVTWAEPFAPRTWAIESAGGLGYLLANNSSPPVAQRYVAAYRTDRPSGPGASLNRPTESSRPAAPTPVDEPFVGARAPHDRRHAEHASQ